jgi:hypothetical protein
VEELAKAQVIFLLRYLHILWMSGYRTMCKDLQRRQLEFPYSLPTYSLDQRLPYTVERFAKKNDSYGFLFLIYIFFEEAVNVHCAKTTAKVFFFVIHIFFG